MVLLAHDLSVGLSRGTSGRSFGGCWGSFDAVWGSPGGSLGAPWGALGGPLLTSGESLERPRAFWSTSMMLHPREPWALERATNFLRFNDRDAQARAKAGFADPTEIAEAVSHAHTFKRDPQQDWHCTSRIIKEPFQFIVSFLSARRYFGCKSQLRRS